MFGEFKTTGGKLVTVKLTVLNNEIDSAEIRGDFFIHPESKSTEVLHAIQKSIINLPTESTQSFFASHIAAAIPYGVELLGTSANAIAIAIIRALSKSNEGELPTENNQDEEISFSANDFFQKLSQFTWRVIHEQPLAPEINVALDELLLEAVATKKSQPTLRFWRWSSQAVIIGRCQSVQNEVDLQAASERNVKIVRRMTGGGAMFLQPHGAITYSLYLPETVVAGMTIRQSYAFCESWIIQGLRELGVDAHHVPINDIACSEGKIGGAAQARRNGVVLHHTTMAYDMDLGDFAKVLRIGREKLKDKAITSAQKRVSPLVRQTGKKRDEIVNHLMQSFQSRLKCEVMPLTESELLAAEQLVESKYRSDTWTNEIS